MRRSGDRLLRLCTILTNLHSLSFSVCPGFFCVLVWLIVFYTGKISNAPSANIFANKEYEMLLRSLNLRRLSYVILAGDKNQFLTQLPTIQEKLVDIFRSVTSPVVQSEVFICIRVLLCRLSPHNLTSFWPVIFTEMVSLLMGSNFLSWSRNSFSIGFLNRQWRLCQRTVLKIYNWSYLPVNAWIYCLSCKQKNFRCNVQYLSNKRLR